MLAIAPLVLTLSPVNAIFVGVFLSVGATLLALWRALRNFAGARADREARGYRGLRWAVTFAAIPLVVWCSVQSYARVFRVANPLTTPPAASP